MTAPSLTTRRSCVALRVRRPQCGAASGCLRPYQRPGRRLALPVRGYTRPMLLILGIILLVIAIAGGAIVHPILFALAIVAIVLFFLNR